MFSQRRNKVSPDRISATHNPDDGINASGVFPFSTKNPNDFRAGFEVLYSLIECRVVERLEQIFEHVRRIEESGSNHAATRRAIRLPEVLDMLGIGKSTLYSRINPASPYYESAMPKPFKLGAANSDRAPSVWWESEVLAYLELRAQYSRAS